jgi:hypothetical protein
MNLVNNRRLYDIATRHQIYVEGVKMQQAQQFNLVLAELRIELKSILGRIKYKNLDALTKLELNRLVVSVRSSQSKIYNAYTQKILEQLKDFMKADLQISKRMYSSAKAETEENPEVLFSEEEAEKALQEESGFYALFGIAAITGQPDRLWSNVTNSPIPANGLYLLPFLKTFSISAQSGVENIIRKAWSNSWTVQETIDEILSEESKQGASSQLQKVGVQAGAVLATATQHVSAIVGAAVMSSMFDWYVWHSVMDSKTSDICISRNRKRYRFGKGPLPPAHIRCRSHIAPVLGSDDILGETLYTWTKKQPDDVQDDIIGKQKAEDLRKDKLKEKDLQKFEPTKPLSIEEFKKKIKLILSR